MVYGCSVITSAVPPLIAGGRGINEVKRVSVNVWELKLDPLVASWAKNEFSVSATPMNRKLLPGEVLTLTVDKATQGYLYVYVWMNGATDESDFDVVIELYRS
jgi:hypothetical protein